MAQPMAEETAIMNSTLAEALAERMQEATKAFQVSFLLAIDTISA